MSDHLSWWCHLTREELDAEILKRADGWKRQKVGLLDAIGDRLMRDSWEPRRDPHTVAA